MQLDYESLEKQEADLETVAEESDQEDVMDEDAPSVAHTIINNNAKAQNKVLYGEAGQVNPKLLKAAKKKAKKKNAVVSDEAFDFTEEFDMEDE